MKIAWLFPGQGSQEVGMGRSVAEAYASARAVYAEADAAVGTIDGRSLSSLCFEGPLEALTLTVNTQPALVATSSAIVAAIREAYPTLPAPAAALGHSLGEYSALTAAGAMALSDAVRACRARGEAMQAAVPPGQGSMAAVMGLDPAALEDVCAEASQAGEPVSPANFNAPGQIVIAGAAPAVARALELAQSRGAKCIPLKVSAPFHCALMRPAAEALRAALEPVRIESPQFPVIANVDAEPNTEGARVAELLVRQVDAPVQWTRSVERAAAMGITLALEIGPGKVLAGLVKRIDKRIRVVSVADADGVARLAAELG
jgi:[acyl-carrier-protein] S-malonyltransferase